MPESQRYIVKGRIGRDKIHTLVLSHPITEHDTPNTFEVWNASGISNDCAELESPISSDQIPQIVEGTYVDGKFRIIRDNA